MISKNSNIEYDHTERILFLNPFSLTLCQISLTLKLLKTPQANEFVVRKKKLKKSEYLKKQTHTHS